MKTHLLKLTPAEFCAATNACREGRAFAEKFTTMSEVWDNCPKPDWMFWILNAIDAPVDEKAERLYAVWCARNTPMADGRTTGALLTDPRSIAALEVAERFAHGNATREELEEAGAAAGPAAGEAAAWDATWASAEVAARASAWAAARELRARNAGWDAAWAAAWAAAPAAAARAAQSNHLRTVIKNPFVA